MNKDYNFLMTEPVGRLFCRLAAPAIIAQLVNLLYSMIDRIYIGHYDATGLSLAGIGICTPILMAVSAFACLAGAGGAPRASIHMGRRELDKAEKILGNCLTMVMVSGLLLTAILGLAGRPMLLLFGASPETIGPSWDYLSIYLFGTVCVQISLGMNSFISAQGFTKISMLSVIIGTAVNIVLDPVFIFLFDMGTKGAALATVAAQTVSAIWILSFLCGKKTLLKIRKKNLRPDLSVMTSCLSLGISPFIMNFTESVLFICFNTSLLKYGGDIAVGSMAVLSMLMQFCFMPLSGLAQGAQPITSYNFGAGNYDRVRQSFRTLLKACMTYSVILWALAMAFPATFVGLFNSGNPELAAYTARMLRIYGALLFVLGAQVACQQTFVAMGNAKISFFLACLRKLILLIPLIYLLPAFMEDQAMAVFLAEPVADFFAVGTTVILFAKHYRTALTVMPPDTERQEVSE